PPENRSGASLRLRRSAVGARRDATTLNPPRRRSFRAWSFQARLTGVCAPIRPKTARSSGTSTLRNRSTRSTPGRRRAARSTAAGRPWLTASSTRIPAMADSSAIRAIYCWLSPLMASNTHWSSMNMIWRLFTIIACAVISLSCNSCSTVLTRKSAITIYVTNEASGDLSVIDAANNEVIATLPLGKRPRGIQITPDRKNIFVALSGSPIAGPGEDEDSLPPPDRSADGVGIGDLARNALLRLMPPGSDPEQFAISRDGGKLYVANEDAGVASVVDARGGQIVKTLAVGKEPEGVGISPDGKTVYVTSENDGSVSVIETDDNHIV